MGVKVIESTRQDGSHYSWLWHCPGCNSVHACDGRWTFNGDVEKPTFRASVLVYEVKNTRGEVVHPRCHSYVTNGRIEFLADSTNGAAGKTMDLPDWDERHPVAALLMPLRAFLFR